MPEEQTSSSPSTCSQKNKKENSLKKLFGTIRLYSSISVVQVRQKMEVQGGAQFTPSRKWISISDLVAAHPTGQRAAWQVSVCGRHELWQLTLAGHADLHLTSEHMSGRGPSPLGCTGVALLPPSLTGLPVCHIQHSLHFICSTICLSFFIHLIFTQFHPETAFSVLISSRTS